MAKEKPQIEMKDFLQFFKKLKANWHLDESRADDIIAEYFAICQEVGLDRFRSATDSIINASEYKFFPTISEFRGYLPKAAKNPLCGKCESGWIMVPDPVARGMYGNPNATMALRCECRRGPSYQAWRESPEWRPFQ